LLDYLIEYLRGGSGWLHSKSDRAGDTAATRVVTVDQKRSGESVEQSWGTGKFLVWRSGCFGYSDGSCLCFALPGLSANPCASADYPVWIFLCSFIWSVFWLWVFWCVFRLRHEGGTYELLARKP